MENMIQYINQLPKEALEMQVKVHQKKNQKMVLKQLFFYSDSIVFNKKRQGKKYIKLNQRIRFDMIKVTHSHQKQDSVVGFVLQHSQQIEQFYFCDSKDHLQVKNFLSARINRLNFHMQFSTSKKIGTGSFASVYSTKRIQDNSIRAVKAISKKNCRSKTDMVINYNQESIRLQINVLRKINHKNIIKLYEVYQTQNSIYMITDLYQGNTLNVKLREQPQFFNQENITSIFFQMCSALSYLNQKKISHRDLKLENILFNTKQQNSPITIVDFGLADFTENPVLLFTKCGTPGYVAPQIITNQSKQIKCISDMFSVGVIIYTLFAKDHLFKGQNNKEILKNNQKCDVSLAIAQLKNISYKMKNILKRCLVRKPHNRITAKQALQQLTKDNQNVEFTEQYSNNSSPIKEQNIDSFTFKTPLVYHDGIEINLKSPQVKGKSPVPSILAHHKRQLQIFNLKKVVDNKKQDKSQKDSTFELQENKVKGIKSKLGKLQ